MLRCFYLIHSIDQCYETETCHNFDPLTNRYLYLRGPCLLEWWPDVNYFKCTCNTSEDWLRLLLNFLHAALICGGKVVRRSDSNQQWSAQSSCFSVRHFVMALFSQYQFPRFARRKKYTATSTQKPPCLLAVLTNPPRSPFLKLTHTFANPRFRNSIFIITQSIVNIDSTSFCYQLHRKHLIQV